MSHTTSPAPLERLSSNIIIAMGLVSFALYAWLPDHMPIHWDRWGRPDSWIHKSIGAFMMPLFAIFIVDGMRLLARLSPAGYEVSRFQDAWDATLVCLTAFFALIHAMMLAVALGVAIAVHRVVPAAVGLLIAAIGLYLPRYKRNWWAGIRTPWTLSSEQAWDETHRRAGPMWVGGGLALAVAGWFAAELPGVWLALLAGLIASTIWVSWSCRRD